MHNDIVYLLAMARTDSMRERREKSAVKVKGTLSNNLVAGKGESLSEDIIAT